MSAINVAFDLANAEMVVIPVDRWGEPRFTLQVETGGTVLLEGTLARVNRGETPAWFVVNEQAGTGIAAQAVGLVGLEPNPYEAFRVTATGAVTGRLMQTGGGGL